MIIFLVGFMGCGKTTTAIQLASHMHCPYVDLDQLIEKASETSVDSFFNQYGEEAFRKFEQNTLQSYAYPSCAIVATGGGTACYRNNMEWMNKYGITIYLKVPLNVLEDRLTLEQEKRPLIRGLNAEQLKKFIGKKLTEREIFYQKAHYTVDGLQGDLLKPLIDIIHKALIKQ